jgi:hypothetical protein
MLFQRDQVGNAVFDNALAINRDLFRRSGNRVGQVFDVFERVGHVEPPSQGVQLPASAIKKAAQGCSPARLLLRWFRGG